MVLCAAINCNVKSGENVSMFFFPTDSKKCKLWLNNLRREGFSPSKHAKVCERHFASDQFTMDPAVARSCGYNRFYLKDNAVPTIFDFSTNYKTQNMKRKGSEENSIKTIKAPRKSKAVIKRQALETLKSLNSVDEPELAEDVEQICNTSNSCCQQTEQETVTTNFADCVDCFEAFTQTPYNLIERRNVAVQADILTESQQAATTRTIETQTDPFDHLEDLNSSYVSLFDSVEKDPDWLPSDDICEEPENNLHIETEGNPARERKFIVFESALDSLFQFCRLCGDVLIVNKVLRGSMISVTTECPCGNFNSWQSQPLSGTMPLGNLILAGALLFSGSSPAKAFNMFKHAGVEMFTVRTYTNIQSAYLVPAVESVWQIHQLDLMKELKESDQPLVLGGDARCCSPGHTAKYGSYSLMDLRKSKILDIRLVQCNEVKNSYAMEMEGLKRCLAYMMENDMCISQLVTDRHSQVKAYMKNQRPEIEHFFDCWHVAKGVYKKLEKKGKKKACRSILQWARSISNHLYWCAASSNGDGELVLQKWQSILNHVTNVHEGHGDRFAQCEHRELEEKAWMKQGSTAHEEMKSVVNGKLLVKDIKKLSPGQQTSGLEAFHKVVCHFAPKLVHFFHSQIEARLYLAALHFNENSERAQALTKDGSPMFAISYPKSRKGEGIAKEVKEQQTFNYIDRLMDEMLLHREVHTTYTRARQYRSLGKERPGPVSQSTPHRPKQDIVNSHVRRFNKL